MHRRRTGKGVGDNPGGSDRLEGSGDHSASVAGENRPVDGAGVEAVGLQGNDVQSRDARSSGEIPGNPFWSQRAREELQLQLARPDSLPSQDFLGTASEMVAQGASGSGVSSSSTELRAVDSGGDQLRGPAGRPTVYGPGVLRTTVEEGSGVLQENARSAVELSSADAAQRGLEVTPGSGEQHGLSIRERNILTQMKNALLQLSQQNEQLMGQNQVLWSRLTRLEEEKSNSTAAFCSAQDPQELIEHSGSGVGFSKLGRMGEGVTHNASEGDREALGVMKYEEGFQQGYLAAKELVETGQGQSCDAAIPDYAPSLSPNFGYVVGSRDRERTPPPNPMRAYQLQCQTTPQGTPVPVGPPPPDVGSTGQASVGALPRVPDFPSFPSTMVHEVPSVKAGGLIGVGGLGYRGQPVDTVSFAAGVGNVHRPSGTADPGGDPWAGGVPVVQDGGRDPYAPKDRVYWNLPLLEEPSLPEAATRAADWLELVRPLMADLAQSSAVWWQRVEWEARSLYTQWTAASAINRGLLIPSMSSQLSDVRFQRLESRGFSMLQAALPKVVTDELLATRSLNTVSAIFVTLKLYAPGGLAERNELLDSLTNLGTAKTSQEAVAQIRRWHRSIARATSMGVVVPDPARLIKALDGLSEALLKKHVQVAFRLSQARTLLQLDHVPSMGSLQEFARIVQSEWEMVAVSGVDEGGGKPKLAKMETEEGKGGGGKEKKGGKAKGGKDEGVGTSEAGKKGESGKGGGKGDQKPCGFYLTNKGCTKGRSCGFFHDFSKAKGESRCYNCGSLEHRQGDCARPPGKGQGDGQGKGKGGGKGSASTPTNGQGAGSGSASATNRSSADSAPNNSQAQTTRTPNISSVQGGTTVPGGVPVHQQNQQNQAQTTSNITGPLAQTASAAQAQVLEEAQKLLKSLRIAAMRVPENREKSPERVGGFIDSSGQQLGSEEERPPAVPNGSGCESEVFVPNVALRRARAPTGLLDGGATHALRAARPEGMGGGNAHNSCISGGVTGPQNLSIGDSPITREGGPHSASWTTGRSSWM